MKNNLLVTKDDIKPLATKDELNAGIAKLATKEELKAAVAKLATKEELKAAVAKLATKEELKGEIKQLESRLIDHLDSFMAEIKAASEEREIVGYRLSNHKDRITTLETRFSFPTST